MTVCYCRKCMDSTDVIDEVNALLKIGVGDSYRLEHIKQAFIQNKTIWVTDENYLKRMREKYLAKHTSEIQPDAEIIFENEPEDKETIHCWKCGEKCPLGANFCMSCGTSIFEIGETSQSTVDSKYTNSKKQTYPVNVSQTKLEVETSMDILFPTTSNNRENLVSNLIAMAIKDFVKNYDKYDIERKNLLDYISASRV